MFTDNKENPNNFIKYIQGPYRRKSNNFIKFSDADFHIMKLWYMAIKNIRITKYNSISSNWFDLYMGDIREIEGENSVYEVFKYAIKDSDICNIDVFKVIYNALSGKRLIQGHGELFNFSFENFESEELEEIEEFLKINKKETPEEVYTNEISELINIYKDYKKISRFKGTENIEEIINHN